MMLRAVPPWMAPTVTTADIVGGTSRDTTVWSWITRWAAAMIGSIAV